MAANFSYIRQPEAITARSFEIIAAELAEAGYSWPDPAVAAVVQRVIHSTADFDFAANLRFHPGLLEAVETACREGRPVVTDVKMVQAGLNKGTLAVLKMETFCYIDQPEARQLAATEGITVSMAAIRLAARQHSGQRPIFAIGNAPTALFELLELVEKGQVQPAAIIGMPVGFVSVVESKEALRQVTGTPWLTALGRKGGTAATAGALNALLLRAVAQKENGGPDGL